MKRPQSHPYHFHMLLMVIGLVVGPLARSAQVETRWLCVCLLTYAQQTGDAASAQATAKRLNDLYGKNTDLFARLSDAFTDDTWKQVLPTVDTKLEQFGATSVYTIEGSPLADLARRLSIDLTSTNADNRQTLAKAFAEGMPDKAIFSYIANGIKAAQDENERYANGFLRGQRMIKYAQDRLAALERKRRNNAPLTTSEHNQLAKAEAHWKSELAKADKMVAECGNLHPIGEGLVVLEGKLLKTIDEMEAIGDL